jgi:hypothetical protein
MGEAPPDRQRGHVRGDHGDARALRHGSARPEAIASLWFVIVLATVLVLTRALRTRDKLEY